MQTHKTEEHADNEDSLFSYTKKRTTRSRKWREIEEVKAKQRLRRELKEIDQSFEFSITDLM